MTVFVGNLPFTLTEEEVSEHFKAYKPTKVAFVQERGFAFVDVEDEERMIKELKSLNIGGRNIIVTKARDKKRRRKKSKTRRRR